MEQNGEDLRLEQDGEDLRQLKDGEDLRPEQDGEDLRLEQDGEDLRLEQDGQDLRLEQDGQDLILEQDGQDLRLEQDGERIQARGPSAAAMGQVKLRLFLGRALWPHVLHLRSMYKIDRRGGGSKNRSLGNYQNILKNLSFHPLSSLKDTPGIFYSLLNILIICSVKS